MREETEDLLPLTTWVRKWRQYNMNRNEETGAPVEG